MEKGHKSSKSIFSKIGGTLLNLLFYPVVALLLAMVVMFACGIRPYITMSGSMEPYMQTGSICFVNTRVAYDEIKVGDVIAFNVASGARVTHRVIAITEEGMETKGDNNEISDGVSTTRANYHGKTLFSIPYIGYAVKYAQQPVVIAIGAIFVLGIVAVNLVDRFVSDEEEKPEGSDAAGPDA